MLSPLVRVDVLASHPAWRPHSDDKGDREAAATWRAGGRNAEECPRKTTRLLWRRAGMIDAARGWKARATAGCAQAPKMKPQAGPRSSPARHGRADSPDEAKRSGSGRRKRPSPFAKVKEAQPVDFETVLSLTRLSPSRQLAHVTGVAERSRMLNGSREVAGRGSLRIVVKAGVRSRDEQYTKRPGNPGIAQTRLSLKGRIDWMGRKSR